MTATYFNLSAGPFQENWSATGRLSAPDDWSAVPSIIGYRGDGLVGSTGANPSAVTGTSTIVDVNVNQLNPNTFTTGGVTEFELADPTVALSGSGTARAPYLVLHLDATGRENVTVSFNLRDLDGSGDNAQQQIAVQYRIGDSGDWIAVPGGYVSDASTGPNLSGQVTPVSVTLPDAADNQGQLQVRVITTDAIGADEWIGVDDIVVDSTPLEGGEPAAQQVRFQQGSVALVQDEGDAGATNYVFTVERTGGTEGEVTFTGALSTSGVDAADFQDGVLPSFSGVIPEGAASVQVTVAVAGDTLMEADESFTVTLETAVNSRADEGFTAGVSPIQNAATATIVNDDLVHIYDIQGSGHASPLVGQTVSTVGVVTAIDTNGSRGFYIQDPDGDGDTATSDGVFVFLPSGALPEVGHLVRVSGRVTEFTPSGAAAGSLSTTELTNASVTDLGPGPAIEATKIGGVDGRLPPTESLTDGALFYESMEGMLVEVVAPRSTGPTNNFGEIFTVVDNDADPANGYHGTGLTDRGALLISGGEPAFGDTNTVGGDFNPERIQIDDDNGVLAGAPTPKVDTGAILSNVTGVMRYDFGNYEVVATKAVTVAQDSPLVKETTALQGDADHLTVAAYNAENLDPGDGAARFQTIADQVVNTLKAPDILSLQEIQDNDGPTNSAVTSASVTLQTLVDRANALAGGEAQYAWLDNPFIGDDTNGGEPGGNIRTAFIYRQDRLDFVEGSLRTIGADGQALTTQAAAADQQTDPDHPFFGSRPPLVADFVFNGEVVTVIDVHFTSKGGSAPLLGSDQPPLNAGEVQRAAQAQAVNTFIDSLRAADPNAKVIVAGDVNEFSFEEPMKVLRGEASIADYDVPGDDPFYATAAYAEGGEQILADLQDLLPEAERYDYVFDGNGQSLDHLLATANLAKDAEFDVVRINADFADQTSDHDPLVARFRIPAQAAPVFTSAAALTVAENAIAVAQITAADPNGDEVSFALTGGADQALFRLDSETGVLVFEEAPDFEAPQDQGGDNVYDLLITATDSTGRSVQQQVQVSVTNVAEANLNLKGGAGADTLVGHDGADRIEGGANGDSLIGAAGADTLGGGNGADTLSGGSGADQLAGGNDRDQLIGGSGNDTLDGGNAEDLLSGGAGDDRLIGGNGEDTLLGGEGENRLNGGNGADLFVFHDEQHRSLVEDFRSDDLILFEDGVFSNFAEVIGAARQDGADTVISYGASEIVLQNIRLQSLNAGDFLFA